MADCEGGLYGDNKQAMASSIRVLLVEQRSGLPLLSRGGPVQTSIPVTAQAGTLLQDEV
jgi:hypothetical protein